MIFKQKLNLELIPTLMTLTGMIVLVALGIWQVERQGWKTHLLDTITERMAEAPVPLAETLDDPARWEYRRVTVAGRYSNDKTIFVGPRVLDGEAGYHVITPFVRASGGVMLVNRGWSPGRARDGIAKIDGPVLLEGVLRLPAKPGAFAPVNNPQKDEWYRVAVDEVAAAKNLENVFPVVLNLTVQGQDDYPKVVSAAVNIANNHTQYAFFWFTMAGVLAVIFALYHFKKTQAE